MSELQCIGLASGVKSTHLAIKNWQSFQHYHDRRPPWIKLYVRLLDDLDFLAMPERAQLHLMKLWLLAARLGHPLPNNPTLLAGKMGLKRIMIEPLIKAGFLIETCEQNASTFASTDASTGASKDSEQDASTFASPRARPRARESTEVEGEGQKLQLPTTADAVRDALQDDTHRLAFDTLLARAGAGRDVFATKVQLLAGVRESPVPIRTYNWLVIGDGMVDLAQTARPVTHLPGFCRTVAARRHMPAGDESLAAAASRLFLEGQSREVAHA